MAILYLALGTLFGFVLSRSGATDYDFIQGMFLLTNLQLFGIIGVAVAVTAAGLVLLKRRGRALGGAPLKLSPKAFNRGTVAGSILFGVGWSMTGMCPGPVLVNVGEGKLYAIAALVGVLARAGAFGALHPRLAGAMGLPAPRP